MNGWMEMKKKYVEIMTYYERIQKLPSSPDTSGVIQMRCCTDQYKYVIGFFFLKKKIRKKCPQTQTK